jgi:N-acyl-D-aspartate/D-glutamate deacylase
MEYDLKIAGGNLIDGSGQPRRRGDVGIRGRITALGAAPAREKTLDATGRIVAQASSTYTPRRG